MSPRPAILFRRASFWIASLLVLAALAVYWPVRHHDFVEFDDGLYVQANPKVQAGLTGESVRWAFRTTDGGNWHPVTWLSHMLDCQFFGLNAGAHHLTNLFFHVCNTLLLFGVLRRMTGALWRSGLVAALFALHPLHVESVAWVAERKDVLSTCFFLLTLWAYARYAQKSEIKSSTSGLRPLISSWYWLAVLFFALGLMSKPMLVTLPFVLLLLDYWPLRRIRFESNYTWVRSLVALVREKLPFFLLSGVFCGVALWSQNREGAVSSLSLVPFTVRLANAVVAYGRYLAKTFWPDTLAAFYPHPPNSWPLDLVAGVCVLLLLITALAVCRARRQPFFLTGWLWYLGTLVPVIGLIQVGGQSIADRYTYIPLIGIFLSVSWGLGILAGQSRFRKAAVAALSVAAVIVCAVLARFQVGLWRDTDTLFTHAAEVTADNYVAYGNLGLHFADQGNIKVGAALYRAALRIMPDSEEVYNNLGRILADQGALEEARTFYEKALLMNPRFAQVHNNLGLLLEQEGRLDEAISHFLAAQRARPEFAEPRSNLGALYIKQGRLEDALAQFYEALRRNPRSADVRYNLGLAFSLNNQPATARVQLEEALRLRPSYGRAHYQLGIVLAQQGDTAAAIDHLRRALELRFDPATGHERLGSLYLHRGDAEAAAGHYREALKVQPDLLKSLNNLAWILATHSEDRLRDGAEAVRLAKRAVALLPQPQPQSLDTLAAAYAEAGHFPEAVSAAQRAVELARSAGQQDVVSPMQMRLRLYEARLPFHEPPAGNP